MSYGSRNPLLASMANKEKWAALREVYREAGRAAARKGDIRHAMACALYWAEGTKGRHTVCLPNTDPKLILLFYSFLVANFAKPPKIQVSCHEDKGNASQLASRRFWSSLLGVPLCGVSAFKNKDTRKRSGNRKKRHLHGMCILTICSTEALEHIYGALEIYGDVVLGV
jgi:hypothetical protein